MKHNKKPKEKKPISAGKAHELMVMVNKDLLSDYLEASLYELRESTWIALVKGKNKFFSGKMTREKLTLMEKQGYNLIDMIDHRIQLGK